jgi:hypothetical protein
VADDRGWGRTSGAAATGDGWSGGSGAADRERIRAEQRERRVAERVEAAQQRSGARDAARDSLAQERERAREARRLDDVDRRRARDAAGETAAVARRRGPGAARTGGDEQGKMQRPRDTRSYHTVVDADRIRELARRGASLTGLAGAFGVSVEEVQAVLAGEEQTADGS